MTKKLTLSINEKTIEKAKRISRKRGKSISRLVEEYLNSLSESDEKKVSALEQIDKIMSKYRSKIKVPEDGNYKEIIAEAIWEKHGGKKTKRKITE